MTTIDGADVAGLLDALGRPDAAATLRWGEEFEAPTLAEFKAQAAEAEESLTHLESLLCRACAKKWNKAKGG